MAAAKATEAAIRRAISAWKAAEAKNIIRRIAEGHNNPRELCADWVSRWDQNEAGPQGPEDGEK